MIPDPLVPADCDLRDFAFMPIDIMRLFNSEFHAKANDAEWRAGLTLWLKSYHQVPAASIPDDDVSLARLAEFGRDVKSWKKVRAMALYGWIKCTDDRLYHPVVAEKANEAWARKLSQRERGRKGNEKRWGTGLRNAIESGSSQGVAQESKNGAESMLSDVAKESQKDNKSVAEGIADRSLKDRKGQGQGQGEVNPLSVVGDGVHPPSSVDTPPKKKGGRSVSTQLPDGFAPDDNGLAYATARRLTVEVELTAFRNHHAAKGSTFASWQAAWRTWCDKAVSFGRGGSPPNGTARQMSLTETRAATIAALTEPKPSQRHERDITPDAKRLA